MKEVSIPVHPLSMRALQAEYGHGSIVMSNHDALFTFITCSPLRSRIPRSIEVLSASVTFAVNDSLARHLEANADKIGLALLKMHKQELCKFAAAAVMFGFKGGAKAALYVWLQERGVGEDDYSLETSYKLWQRFGWKIIQGKTATFRMQMRGKAAVFLHPENKRLAKPINTRKPTFSDIEIELSAMRFMKSVWDCFNRPHKRLANQARIYFYVKLTGLSERRLAKKLGIHPTCIQNAKRIIRRKTETNITLKRLLSAALPDPTPPPASSGHDSRLTRSGKGLHPHTRLDQAPGTNRSARSSVSA